MQLPVYARGDYGELVVRGIHEGDLWMGRAQPMRGRMR